MKLGTANLAALTAGTPRDLRNLQIKLTYVGPHAKPIPTVVFTTFYHLIDMEAFVSLRRPELEYGPDEYAVWNFTIRPEEMHAVVAALAELDLIDESAPHLALALVLSDSRLGDVSGEEVLGPLGAQTVIRAIHSSIGDDNELARSILSLQLETVFGSGANPDSREDPGDFVES